LKDLVEQWKISCIMVSHDAEDLLSWADRVLVMREGRLIQDGSPETIYGQPLDSYTASLLGEFNLLEHPLAATLLPGIDLNTAQKWMLRPEQLSLVDKELSPVTAIIREIHYCGSHYMAVADIMGQELKIRTTSKLNKGDTVGLSLLTGHPWII